MAKKKPILERMKNNPAKGWNISDVETICSQHGVAFNNPSRGSHFKITSQYIDAILTVPFKRPIKPVYIRSFVSFVETHIDLDDQVEE